MGVIGLLIVAISVWIFVEVFRDIKNPKRAEERARKIEEQSKKFDEEQNEKLREEYKEKEGLEYKQKIYVKNAWGIDKSCGEILMILIFSDRIRFSGKLGTRDLLLKDIVNLEVLTDTQIEEKSKLGQFAMIGVLALATKPKTEEIDKTKLIINASECGIKFSIAVETLKDTLSEAKVLGQYLEEYRKGL